MPPRQLELYAPQAAQTALNFPKGKREDNREHGAVASDKEVKITLDKTICPQEARRDGTGSVLVHWCWDDDFQDSVSGRAGELPRSAGDKPQ